MIISPETIKLLEEYIDNKLFNTELGNDCFGSDTKSKGNKSKNKQWNDIKIKSFQTAEKTINK